MNNTNQNNNSNNTANKILDILSKPTFSQALSLILNLIFQILIFVGIILLASAASFFNVYLGIVLFLLAFFIYSIKVKKDSQYIETDIRVTEQKQKILNHYINIKKTLVINDCVYINFTDLKLYSKNDDFSPYNLEELSRKNKNKLLNAIFDDISRMNEFKEYSHKSNKELINIEINKIKEKEKNKKNRKNKLNNLI